MSYPFQRLAAQLRREGLPVGIREHLALADLVRGYDGCSRSEFRAAVTALLARSREDAARVGEVFDRLYPAGAPVPTLAPAPHVQESGPIRPPRWALLAIAAVAGVLAGGLLGYGLHAWWGPGPATAPGETKQGQTTPTGPDESTPPPPPPEPRRNTSRLLLPELAVLLAGTGLGLAFVRLRRLRRGRALDAAWTSLPGPRQYRLQRPEPRFTKAQLDDMARVLARSGGGAGPSHELDVDETVERTLRAGIPVPVRKTRPGARGLQVLVDAGPDFAPFVPDAEALLTGLARRGVEISRWYFDRTPGSVAERRLGAYVPLDRVARAAVGDRLLVLGSTSPLGADDRPPAWARAMRSFADRAWLVPAEDPASLPPLLRGRDALAPAFPFTPAGAMRAARLLSHSAARPAKGRSEVRLEGSDVLTLRALASLVPAPSWEAVLALRGHFLPDSAEEVVIAARPIVEGGAGVPEAREAWRWLAARDPGGDLARKAAKFLAGELQRARPADERSGATLRWRRDLALLESWGGHGRGDELRLLRDSPLGPELEESLEAQHAIPRTARGAPAASDAAPAPAPLLPVPGGRLRGVALGAAALLLASGLPLGAERMGWNDAIVEAFTPKVITDPIDPKRAPVEPQVTGRLLVRITQDGSLIANRRYIAKRPDDTGAIEGRSGRELELVAGRWFVQVDSEGMGPQPSTEVDVPANGVRELEVAIVAEVGMLAIEGLPRNVKPSSVAVDGKTWRGGDVSLAPGPVVVRLESEYYSVRRDVTIQAGKKTPVSFAKEQPRFGLAVLQVDPPDARVELVAPSRSVSVRATPGFDVPLKGQLTLRSDQDVTIRVRRDGHAPRQLTIPVRPATTSKDAVSLEPLADAQNAAQQQRQVNAPASSESNQGTATLPCGSVLPQIELGERSGERTRHDQPVQLPIVRPVDLTGPGGAGTRASLTGRCVEVSASSVQVSVQATVAVECGSKLQDPLASVTLSWSTGLFAPERPSYQGAQLDWRLNVKAGRCTTTIDRSPFTDVVTLTPGRHVLTVSCGTVQASCTAEPKAQAVLEASAVVSAEPHAGAAAK